MPTLRSCGLAFSLAFAALSFLPRSAFAQSEDQAAARALFTEGRRLLAAGQYAEACPKLESARDLYPSAGVLLNLADCYEKTGRTASAWTTFLDASSVAERANRGSDVAEAKRRQAAIEAKLVRVVLHLQGPTPGLVVHRNGVEISRGSWDTAIPVDPGSYEFRAEAPGYTSFVKTLVMSEPGKTFTVDVPELTLLPRPAAPPPVASTTESTPEAPKEEASPGGTQRVIGLTVGGAGILGLGASGVLAIVAKSKYGTAENETGSRRVTDSASAGHLADAATVALLAGAVVTATGLVLWITAPSAPIAVGTNGSDVFVSGAF